MITSSSGCYIAHEGDEYIYSIYVFISVVERSVKLLLNYKQGKDLHVTISQILFSTALCITSLKGHFLFLRTLLLNAAHSNTLRQISVDGTLASESGPNIRQKRPQEPFRIEFSLVDLSFKIGSATSSRRSDIKPL